jgi:adenylate cyclase
MKYVKDPIIDKMPHRIVITGGPLAGKSTVLDLLRNNYNSKARVMTEVASMLLTNGYPQPGKDITYSPEWLHYVNQVILPTQLNMEHGHLHAAVMNKNRAVFFDRGLLDPSAYLPKGVETLKTEYGIDSNEIYERYSMVIHLQSLACINPEMYENLKGTNPARYDTAEQAKQRDEMLQEAYRNHPNYHFISAEGGIDNITKQFLQIVSPILDKEIERKWMWDDETNYTHMTFADSPSVISSERIRQIYIYDGVGAELRVRNTGNKIYTVTAKNKGDLARTEWERVIPVEIYEMFEGKNLPTISKTRHYMKDGEYTLEIDQYDNTGLVTIEVEFPNEYEAQNYTLPEWIIGARDETKNPNFKNATLAQTIPRSFHLMGKKYQSSQSGKTDIFELYDF